MGPRAQGQQGKVHGEGGSSARQCRKGALPAPFGCIDGCWKKGALVLLRRGPPRVLLGCPGLQAEPHFFPWLPVKSKLSNDVLHRSHQVAPSTAKMHKRLIAHFVAVEKVRICLSSLAGVSYLITST